MELGLGETMRWCGAKTVQVIGMLGGMSGESSAKYYRLADELVRERLADEPVRERLGGLGSARVLLASADFAEVERL